MTTSYVIRNATKDDIPRIVELIARLKRLHGEFDPLLATVDDLEAQIQSYVEELLNDQSSLVLVVDFGGSVEGVLTAKIVDRRFYKPRIVGQIVDIYVMPAYRRRGLGAELVEKASKELMSRGAEMIFAEFPVKNTIAESFYHKQGFREITGVFARETGYS